MIPLSARNGYVAVIVVRVQLGVLLVSFVLVFLHVCFVTKMHVSVSFPLHNNMYFKLTPENFSSWKIVAECKIVVQLYYCLSAACSENKIYVSVPRSAFWHKMCHQVSIETYRFRCKILFPEDAAHRRRTKVGLSGRRFYI